MSVELMPRDASATVCSRDLDLNPMTLTTRT